uniref:DDE Tnp4 domain-containing protein n=1 Tax=Lactuca sativa TaxID=4236 RepID=A0A9R1UTF4_LACSA|nr:hypothetical protein LSAT_V11C800412770 [Lactuca sativa]
MNYKYGYHLIYTQFSLNCIGVIDDTHVTAWAPSSKQKSFRGRRAVLVTQNVMAICSHEMMFTFVYSDWEGTANESHVFYDAVIRPENKFPIPVGAFSVLKKRFHILQDIPNYPLRRQMLIPHACCALHTYIRMEDRVDTLFTRYGDKNLHNIEESLQVVLEGFPLNMTIQDEMLQVRDSIADMLLEKYTKRHQRHLLA